MSTVRLERLEGWPKGLDAIEAREIRSVLPQPTLITIPGRAALADTAPLFVSLMLHGNETTGFEVLKALAARFVDEPPPRALLIFVGNVFAAEKGVRVLPGQPDYNRIWAGGSEPEHALAAEVLAAARAAKPFASIDVHNNTGRNPLYGCVSALTPANLTLAALFSRIGVYYRNPPTTQSIAFTPICPAVTVECGRPGVASNDAHAAQFVLDVLHLHAIDEAPAAHAELTLHHTLGRMLVDPETLLVFGEGEASETALRLPADIDTANFSELPAGWALARTRAAACPLKVVNEASQDITADFIIRDGETLRLARSVTPAMLTLDPAIVRQDCLGYLMEPMPKPSLA